jgi:ADP-ribose pyrophosphatase YjhB (NUDIX family)
MNQLDWEASIQKADVVVGCLVKRDSKYLLVKENPNGEIVYNLPAGHVDKGERLETAAIRETKEETGYDVRLIEQIALYHETAPQSVKHIYLAEITDGEEQAQEGEILEVVWKSFDEIRVLEQNGEFRAPWVFDVISNYENKIVNGEIFHRSYPKRKDYLFRVSLKSVIFNDAGEILVVKEKGRDWWDIPGGGIDHGESVKEALTRELREEVLLTGDFEYETILTEDPRYLANHNLYQMRLTFLVKPESLDFSPGDDGDEVMFIDPVKFKESELITERKIYEYSESAKARFK